MSNCSIAKTGRCLIAFLQGFFFHATQDLTRQSNGIVFIHPFDDALDQAAKRSLDQWFRYTDHVYIILLEHTLVYDRLFLVTGETTEFPYQDHINGVRGLLRQGDHLLKLRALLCMPAGNTLSKDKVSGYNHIILLSIIQQKTFLRIRRKFCLVLCRDADVKTCHFTAHKYHLGFIKYVILSIKITATQMF